LTGKEIGKPLLWVNFILFPSLALCIVYEHVIKKGKLLCVYYALMPQKKPCAPSAKQNGKKLLEEKNKS
jgi:hypothetical protein